MWPLPWLQLDVVATFPWAELGSGSVVGLRLFRILRLSRVFKMIRAAGFVSLSARLSRLLFAWFLIVHWAACAWCLDRSRSGLDALCRDGGGSIRPWMRDPGDMLADRMADVYDGAVGARYTYTCARTVCAVLN